MKTLNETFSDTEFEALKQAKGKLNWHDFILALPKLKKVWEDNEDYIDP